MSKDTDDYIIRPNPLDPRLTERVTGIDQTGAAIETSVTVERALTIFLNWPGDRHRHDHRRLPGISGGRLSAQPEHAACRTTTVTGVDYDEELAVVVVRTKRKTNYEKKLKKKVQTSGCAQGTVFGDLMEALEDVTLPKAELAHLVALCAHPQDQHHAVALSRGGRHPWLRAGGRGSAAGLYGGRRPPQRGRQDRRLDVQGEGAARATRFSTPPAGSPPRW